MFSKLKIIDASTVLAGPSVGTFFAELGASVIKIENTSIKDVTRSWKLPKEDPSSSISAYFSSVNYGKTYVNLNLKDINDHTKFIELIQDADILISNFKRGDEAKLNIEDSFLRSFNPQLIIGKINGFGENIDRVAYDLILQAETGFMSMNGTPDSGPIKMPVALIDVLAAHQLKEGLLISLLERKETQIGRTVCVSLYDAAIASLVNQASNYLMNNHTPKRIGSLHPNIAPYGELFQTKDYDLVTFAIGNDIHFQKLCDYLQINTLPQDKKFNSNQSRVIHRMELFEILQDKIIHLSTEEILTTLINQNVPVGKVKNLQEVFTEEHVKKRILSENIDGVPTQRVSSIAFKWK